MATTEQLLDLDGIGQRQATFRWDLLDASLAKQGELMPLTTATITNDTSRAIQRTTSISLVEEITQEFQLGQARIRPYFVLENGHAEPLGTFLFHDGGVVRDSLGSFFTGSLMDLGFLVDQKSTVAFGVRAGANLNGYIEQILVQQGVTYFQVDATGTYSGSPIGWPPNTSWLTIVNELAAMQGCLPLYFEADGRARVRVLPDLATADVDVSYSAGLNIFDTGIGESDNVLTAPNLFVVIDAAATGTPIRGTYAVPESAPNSEANLSRQVPLVAVEQGLPDVAAANERARVLSITDGAVVEGRSFDGPPDGRHGTYSIVEFESERFLERSWSLICAEGANHSHQLSKVFT